MAKIITLGIIAILLLFFVSSVSALTETLYAEDLVSANTINNEPNAYDATDGSVATVVDLDKTQYVDAIIDNHSASGSITSVKFQIKLKKGTDWANDHLTVAYSEDSSTWHDVVTLYAPADALTWTANYTAILVDTWTEVDDIQIRITGDQNTGPDNGNIDIDAYHVYVEYSHVYCTTPVITDLTNTTPGTANITITWTTNQSADNRVKYSKYSDLSNETWSSWDNDTSSISIAISSLDAGTLYYYQATSYNGTNSSCSITEPVSSPYKNFTTQSTGGAYNITLLTGWNIIGWIDTTERTAHYIGADIGANCTYISECNKTTGNCVNHNMAGPEGENNFAIERGWGYYVYVTDETVWNRTA